MPHVIILALLFLPLPLLAGEFVPLAGIPGVTDISGPVTLTTYIRALFYIAIALAAMLAVVKLVIAGAKYMLSDVVSSKQSALADIRGSIFGLLLILATVIILETINTQILDTDITLDRVSVQSADPINVRQPFESREGDRPPIRMTGTFSEDRMREMCENIDMENCRPNAEYNCYQGEFRPRSESTLGLGSNACIVRAENNFIAGETERYSCDVTNIDALTGSTYDCGPKRNECESKGGEIVDVGRIDQFDCVF